jgi:hypothetical protein
VSETADARPDVLAVPHLEQDLRGAPAAIPAPRESPGRATPVAGGLWLSEALVGGLVATLAVVAWLSLVLAHLGAHSLGAVAALSGAVAAAAALGLARVRRLRVPVRIDRVGVAGTVAVGALAAVMFFPGFHYGASDKDPGGYVAHAMEIARTGDYAFYDPASDPARIGSVQLASPGARFPGMWRQGTDTIVPQFFHLWPALLATAYDVGGDNGLSGVAPLCGVLAVCALALATRRAVAAAHPPAAGLVAGGVAGLLLATNMLEVWQAKYPTTEISAQMLFAGTLLGAVVALTTGWAPAAFLAGALCGIGFLDRADDLALLLLAAALGAVLVALNRFDRRAGAFALGLGVVLPHALWQAYSPAAAASYAAANHVPGLLEVAALVAGLFAVAVAARWLLPPRAPAAGRLAAAGRPARQRAAGAAVLVAAAGLLALGFLRPRLFGADYAYFAGQGRRRTYDEQSLDRLGWFVGRPTYLVALAGLAVVALRRWSAALWTLAVPTCAMLPLYAWHTRNSTQLMWWTRRYVPTVLPGLLVLVAIAAGTALVALGARRWTRRVLVGAPALVVVTALAGFFLTASLPLRHHDEMGGSFAITRQLAALAGPGKGSASHPGAVGVFLWPRERCCYAETDLFAGALWVGRGQLSALLPADAARWPSYVGQFVRGFPGSPVFVVTHGTAPPKLAGRRLSVARRFDTALSIWQVSDVARPSHAIPIPVDFTVWRLEGT